MSKYVKIQITPVSIISLISFLYDTAMQYEDEDRDKVVLASDNDLAAAVEHARIVGWTVPSLPMLPVIIYFIKIFGYVQVA